MCSNSQNWIKVFSVTILDLMSTKIVNTKIPFEKIILLLTIVFLFMNLDL